MISVRVIVRMNIMTALSVMIVVIETDNLLTVMIPRIL